MGQSERHVAESALRTAIADGDLLPGARLVEADLVAMLGVSRGNVRLAIDALAAEGLVERIPNKGARVRVDLPGGGGRHHRVPHGARGTARPQGGRAGHRRARPTGSAATSRPCAPPSRPATC